jgi:hypothetical protein
MWFQNPTSMLKIFEAKLHDSGLTDARISKIRPGIEDVFIKLMHHE